MMKIYRVRYMSPHTTYCQVWAGSHAEARKIRVDIKRHPENYNDADLDDSIDIDIVDIPTDKQGLIGWLNSRFSTNNG